MDKHIGIDRAGGRDYHSLTVWQNGKLVYTVSINDSRTALGRWYSSVRTAFSRKKRVLRYAVTHGYTIRILFEDGYTDIVKPRELNAVFRTVPFVPRMRIVKDGRFYAIRHGRIVPFRVWPAVQGIIDSYERKMTHL